MSEKEKKNSMSAKSCAIDVKIKLRKLFGGASSFKLHGLTVKIGCQDDQPSHSTPDAWMLRGGTSLFIDLPT